jgi:hypothetical protein
MAAMNMTRRIRVGNLAFAGMFILTVGGGSLVAGASTRGAHMPYFAVARTLWESEAELVSGALQNVPLVMAVDDLQRGLASGDGDTLGYRAAIATIRDFEGIPLTSETPSQVARSHRDWSQLNAFFKLSAAQVRVLDNDLPAGSFFSEAKQAFEREPVGTSTGDNVPLLGAAAGYLDLQASKPRSRAILYAAAVADLTSLARATRSDLAKSGSSLTNPYRQDIVYLDAFFQTDRL